MPFNPEALRETFRGYIDAPNASDEELDGYIASAIAKFEERTAADDCGGEPGRYLTAPSVGDPDVQMICPVTLGMVRLRDARAITIVEISPTRLNPTWTAVTGYEGHSHYDNSTFLWLELPTDVDGATARVTGKFGLLGLAEIPTAITDALIDYAANRYRSGGAEADGHFPDRDGVPDRAFDRLPPSFSATAKAWRVPPTPLLRQPWA